MRDKCNCEESLKNKTALEPPQITRSWVRAPFKPGVLSVMPNRPVRYKWEYRRKMERHFPIKPGQPIGMALATFYSFSEFPN